MNTQARKFHMNRGAGCLAAFFCLLFFILVVRFLYIQIGKEAYGESLEALAAAKHNQEGSITGVRGKIYDQHGEVLAQDASSYKLIAMLKGDEPIKNKEKTAEKLATVLPLRKEEILNYLNKPLYQVEFGAAANNLTAEQKEQIENMKLQGLRFTEGKTRVYPNGDFASYVIGYAKAEENKKLKGQFGLERSLDKELQAENGKVAYKGDSRGLAYGKEHVVPAKNGNDVYLTLDQRIQSFLEEAMNKAAKQYEPSMLLGIVADPKTGKILAMSSKPSYDPNKRNISYFLNDPVSYAYEPGSTMKIFTLAAAINEGVYNGQAFYQSGRYYVGKIPIRDHNGGYGWGSITFDEGVQRSSNVAFAILAQNSLGFDKYNQYLHKFHLYEKTGIDLPGEGKNTILFDKDIQKITTAFGQGSTVTPIQQIQAATAIANNGKMMKPYVIDKIVEPGTNKVLRQTTPEEVGQPITAESALKVRQLLETVVTSPKGTGTLYKIDGYSVAGKTGTAQIPGKDGKYMSGRENYIFSFLGMAPVEKPELLVYVAIKQPKLKDTEFGATPLSDIFKSVTKNSLQYLQIKPSQVKDVKQLAKRENVRVPDVQGQAMAAAKLLLEKEGLRPIVLGKDKVVSQSSAGRDVLKGDKVFLLGTENKMPNVGGWSIRDVMSLADLLGIQVKVSGSGYVTEQSIAEGTVVQNGAILEVKLVPPIEPQASEEVPPAGT
ncbi:penicillin-binding transpeptidase domain-containing protein [Ectobacillus antri]|uniref:serine-type D-Ala-D-Ala carboxypeptidase n=1 Tax=Ectobacillus antri TaxID=2486280 RepID=A0ABT6GZN3_9BACI|nr:penicillin-binding protein [Ectobacillus antri]MDG4655830.1 penicillin-binding transpeptidase domain-containing protein [Ectobacillus antri]MDG5752505.1 penicillin-binding transpeptidase domain-containing protein [Ectobacillus antri]